MSSPRRAAIPHPTERVGLEKAIRFEDKRRVGRLGRVEHA